jgi:hypothetical protein
MNAEERRDPNIMSILVDFDNQKTKIHNDSWKDWGTPNYPTGNGNPTQRCLPKTTSKPGHTGHNHWHLWVGFWLDFADIPNAPNPEC